MQGNTAALHIISDLTRSRRAVEAEVLSHEPELFHDQLDARRSAVAERGALASAVNGNAAILQQLRSRQEALRRKSSVLHAA